MGFLETLTGQKKILTYEIIFGEADDVGVSVTPLFREIPGPDYIRLWACYQAKIIFNLGFPNNVSAMMAIGSVAKIAEHDIEADTDCFKRANVADVIRFTSRPSRPDEVYGRVLREGGGRSHDQNPLPRDSYRATGGLLGACSHAVRGRSQSQ